MQNVREFESYTVTITGARGQNRLPTHTYGTLSQPFTVQTDIQSIKLVLPQSEDATRRFNSRRLTSHPKARSIGTNQHTKVRNSTTLPRMRLAVLLLLLATPILAQTPRPEDLGTVTGHITCADTQRPARFADVRLVPINSIPDDPGSRRIVPTSTDVPAKTDLNGGYILTDVPPGQYYLRVHLMGYITPIDQFTQTDLNHPTPEIQQRIEHELQLVTVRPNATVQADATVHRGATISGTVLYDDGSPAIFVEVELLRRNAKGQFRHFPETRATDSHGEFRFEALSPGDYVIDVTLNAFERRKLRMPIGEGKSADGYEMDLTSAISIYTGNVFREKDAAIIKVDPDQQTDGADISIPLSQLHEISGTVAAADGHPIDHAHVALRFADSQEPFVALPVRPDGTFEFAYVPEGSYILTVTGARDQNQIPTHTYGTLSQPLTVTTDLQSLILTVPDKPSATASE